MPSREMTSRRQAICPRRLKNLTTSVYLVDGYNFSALGNIDIGYYGAPRTASFTADFRF